MRIGAHESIAGGVSRAFARAEEHGGKSIQIFTKSARGWWAPPLPDDERALFRKESRRARLPAIAHGSYLVNLGTEDKALRKKSIGCVVEELTRCEKLGVKNLVLHPGAHPDEKKGLGLIAKGLDEVHRSTKGFKARVAIEVTAGQGNCLGWKFEHLTEIFSRVASPRRLDVCLDTCHLFAAGHDIATERGYEQVMEGFDRAVGLEKVTCFHLNDCKKPLGCRVDRHEEIGKGTLGLTPFRMLVNDARFEGAIGVLETPFPERYGAAIRLLESLRRR